MIVDGKAWDIHGSLPPGSEHNANRYRLNVSLMVVAPTVEDAIACAKSARPGLVVSSVNHIGERVVAIGEGSAAVSSAASERGEGGAG